MGSRKKASSGKKAAAPSARSLVAQPGPSATKWYPAQIGYSIVLLLLFLPLLMREVEPRWDARDQFYPAFTYVADAFREGRFPLWDPYTNCGFPFHAEPDYFTLNPLAVLLGFATRDTAIGFVVFWLLHWWWGGIGMFQLARRFGASPPGGLAAALSYALSGFFVGHAQHTPYIIVASWLPWIFVLADRAVAESRAEFALLAGAATGFATLGGYPGLNIFAGLALTLWLLLRFLPAGGGEGNGPSAGKRALRTFLTLSIIAGVSLAIWSPILHAFFTEGAGYTDRVRELTPEGANLSDPFPLPALVSLFFPFATIAGREWLPADLSMTNGYAGVLAFPLAAYWFLKGNGKRRPWWLLGFFVFMFLVSLGGQAGLRTALYYLFPPMRYTRFSAPFRLFWILPLALAAGLGLSRLREHPEERRAALGVLLAWAAACLASALALAVVLSARGGGHWVSPRLFLPAAAVLPAGILAVWLHGGEAGGRLSRLAPPLLIALVALDMGGHVYNNRDTAWVARDSMKQAESFHRRITSVPGEPGPRRPPLPFGFFNAQQVVKEPVVQGYVTLKSTGFDETLCQSRFVEVMRSPVRFWISPGAETAHSDGAALAALSAVGSGDAVPVFMENAPAGLPSTRTVPGAYGATRILSYAPERIDMEVVVPGPADGILASTERFAAGWTAIVDGIPGKVAKINLYFRGIAVPPGRHLVVWKYEPELWRPLAFLSLASLLAAAAGATLLIVRRRRRESSSGPEMYRGVDNRK